MQTKREKRVSDTQENLNDEERERMEFGALAIVGSGALFGLLTLVEIGVYWLWGV